MSEDIRVLGARFGLAPLPGYGCRKPNPGFARSRPFGRPSSSLWPFVGRRAPLALDAQ